MTAKTLAAPAMVGTGVGATTLITNPASTTTYIRSIVIHNSDNATRDVEIWLVPNGGSAQDSNRLYLQPVDAEDTVFLSFEPPGVVMSTAGDTLQAAASVGSVVTISAYGFEEA